MGNKEFGTPSAFFRFVNKTKKEIGESQPGFC